VVKILEAASASLKHDGAAIEIQETAMPSLTNTPVARIAREREPVCA
jgi:hypothetical protein